MATMSAHGKLLTAEEAARRLGIDQPALESLVAAGRLSAYRLGGQFLRYRADDIEQLIAHRTPRADVATPAAADADVPTGGWRERVREFFYLHDFYLLAALLLLVFVAVLIRFA